MKINKYVAIAFCLFFITCKKNDAGNNGSSEFVQAYNQVIAGEYKKPASFYIDINKDSVMDFYITSESPGPLAMGTSTRATISSLDETWMFGGKETNDTTYVSKTVSAYTLPGGQVVASETYNYSCDKRDESYSVSAIAQGVFKLSADAAKGAGTAGTFRPGSFLLDEVYSAYSSPPIQRNDTSFNGLISAYHKCTGFSEGGACYLPLKYKSGPKEKQGWIKLYIQDNSAVTLLETGIER